MSKMSSPRAYILHEELLVSHLAGAGLRAMGQGSNFEAQLDALRRFGPMKPCYPCGGKATPVPTAGSGFVPVNPEQYEKQAAAQRQLWESCGLDPPEDLDLWAPDAETVCESCGGFGWLPAIGWYPSAGWPTEDQITAAPTAVRREAGALLDDAAVEVSGRVARWLYMVGRVDPDAAYALVLLWGPGNKRGQKAPFLDVWGLTEAGRRLGKSLEELENLRTEIALMSIPHPLRNLVRQAEEQATRLVERACKAWEAAILGCTPRRPSKPPPPPKENDHAAAA